MATSTVIEEDIACLTLSNGKILLEIAARTATILNEKQEQLQQCKWTDGESNTDTDFSKLACKCAEEAWLTVKQQYPLLSTITMVAIIPDINCAFSKNGETIKVTKNKIELKSSKSLTMPGSTIGKLDINQPLIYCQRPKPPQELYEVRYGQYLDATQKKEYDMFQDRTPRPSLDFAKLVVPVADQVITYTEHKKDDWIPHYAQCALNRLKTTTKSWQEALVRLIIYYAIKDITTIEELDKLRESVRPTEL